MSLETLGLSEELQRYVVEVGVRETADQRELRRETAALENARMQSSPEQGALLAVLLHAIDARRVLEVGTFTGYGALTMALALPEDGRVITCDVSEEWTAIARRAWRRAGVDDRIELRLGPAADTLDRLLADGEAGTFDFAFIDADKSSYDAYYERCLGLVRPRGLIAIDNVLWSGRVANPDETDPDTEALRALNRKLAADSRVVQALVPIADGVTLVCKVA